jgi:hypothetical protein
MPLRPPLPLLLPSLLLLLLLLSLPLLLVLLLLLSGASTLASASPSLRWCRWMMSLSEYKLPLPGRLCSPR